MPGGIDRRAETAEYLPESSSEWVVTVQFAEGVTLPAKIVADLFGAEWRRKFGGLTLYGKGVETGLWTFLTSADGPFFWSSYACHFGEYLLNHDYIMLPFGELNRCQDHLFDRLGVEGRIFVRPDSPLKLFTGQIASRQTFAADLEFMGFYEFPANSLVVASSPKKIVTEWRFIVVKGRIVAGSRYKAGNEFSPELGYDSGAFDLAQEIAALGYEPDPVWVLDVCRDSTNTYSLLEIGGFSFADLYACDKTNLV
jgi:hypothetical protein